MSGIQWKEDVDGSLTRELDKTIAAFTKMLKVLGLPPHLCEGVATEDIHCFLQALYKKAPPEIAAEWDGRATMRGCEEINAAIEATITMLKAFHYPKPLCSTVAIEHVVTLIHKAHKDMGLKVDELGFGSRDAPVQ